MGPTSRSLLMSTFLAGSLLVLALLLETSGATREYDQESSKAGQPRSPERRLKQQRGSTDSPKPGAVNEAGVFALRGKQDGGGGRRGKKSTTTTTTTSTTTEATTAYARTSTRPPQLRSQPLGSLGEEEVIEPAALLVADDASRVENTTDRPRPPALPTIDIVVKPLTKVVLPCELEGNLTRLLIAASRSYRIRPASWLHDEATVDMITIDTRTEMSGTGHRYIGDSSTAALHIDNVRFEDDGTWICQIEDDRGKLLVSRPVRLTVLQSPRSAYLMIDGRRLDPGNLFVPVKEGSELTLECAAEGGNPPPVLAWGMSLSQATLDGPEQPPDNLTIVPATSPIRSGAHLKVLRGHHNATIICVAKHETLTAPMNASILLDVQYEPAFAITRLPGFGIPIYEGMSVSLKCEVDSNPSSAPIWQKDNGPPPVEQNDDGWLNFTKISQAESGWYKCYTRHMLGIFNSIGYFLNVRYNDEMETKAKALNGEVTDSRKMEVQIGGAVTLECDGGCWGHGPGMDPVGGPGPLALSRVVYQDAGEYRCVAPDSKMQDAWRAQQPYHITVTGRPMVHPPSQTMTTKEGDALDVIVEFCAEPNYTKVLWMSEERVYVPGGEARDGVRALPIQDGGTKACYRSILRFEPVERGHAGEWLLLVRSPEGLVDASVSLNVTIAAGYSGAHLRAPSLPRVLLCLALLALLRARP